MSNQADFRNLFEQLKFILKPYAEQLVIEIDQADQFYLNTRYIMKNKKPMYFGSTKINKRYVSFHLMPVYVFPELIEQITPELKARMQGKSCFNFKTVDPALIHELTRLTEKGYLRYQDAGYL